MPLAVRKRSRPSQSETGASQRNAVARNDDRKITFDYVPTEALAPPPFTLKKHSQRGLAALRASIRSFGIVRPILVDQSNTIIAGHALWLSAKELGIEQVPIVRATYLSEAQRVAYSVADNQIANINPWDDDVLRQALGKLNTLDLAGKLDFSIETTGFETKEIDRLLDVKPLALQGEVDVADDIPEVEAVAISKPGDLWTLGGHRLLCGNSLSRDSYLTLMGDERAQMVWSDPPYNVPIAGNVSGLGKKTHREFAMASGEMNRPQFTDFLSTTFGHLVEFSVNGSIHYQCMDWRHMGEMEAAGTGVYADPAQMRHGRLSQGAIRDRTDETYRVTKPGQLGGNIGFGAPEPNIELWRLQQKLTARRRHPQHHFAERYKNTHSISSCWSSRATLRSRSDRQRRRHRCERCETGLTQSLATPARSGVTA